MTHLYIKHFATHSMNDSAMSCIVFLTHVACLLYILNYIGHIGI